MKIVCKIVKHIQNKITKLEREKEKEKKSFKIISKLFQSFFFHRIMIKLTDGHDALSLMLEVPKQFAGKISG
jgi:hypothetical protein